MSVFLSMKRLVSTVVQVDVKTFSVWKQQEITCLLFLPVGIIYLF